MLGSKCKINGAGCNEYVIFWLPPTAISVEEGINLIIQDLRRKKINNPSYHSRKSNYNAFSANTSEKIQGILNPGNERAKQTTDSLQAYDKKRILGILEEYESFFASYKLLIAKRQLVPSDSIMASI